MTEAVTGHHSENTSVENNQCGGNDRWWGFYVPEWNGLGGDAESVLSRDEDHDCLY